MSDYKKNFGMIIPNGVIPIKHEILSFENINEVMNSIDEGWRYRWCDPGSMGCACMGCCNNAVLINGYTKQDWEKWVIENPDTSPKETGYGFSSYTTEKY